MNNVLKLTTLMSGNSGKKYLTLTAITTGAATLTLNHITPTGGNCVVDWGDGSAASTITDGYTGATTHNYTGAGTWTVKISDPQKLQAITLNDDKIVFNSKSLLNCGAALTNLILYGLAAGCTINSADMAHLTLSNQLYLDFWAAGTYAIDSADFAGSPLSFQLYLNFQQAGTYAIDSADFAGYPLSYRLYLKFPAGTYTINRADWDGFARLGIIQVEMGLSTAQVDNILLGLADGFAARTIAGAKVDLLGGGNAAPTGTVAAAANPDIATWTGANAAYELVNDTHNMSLYHWTAVEVAS